MEHEFRVLAPTSIYTVMILSQKSRIQHLAYLGDPEKPGAAQQSLLGSDMHRKWHNGLQAITLAGLYLFINWSIVRITLLYIL